MSYATAETLKKLVGERDWTLLTDRNKDGLEDAGVVTFALQSADDLIDAALAERYCLPPDLVPGVIGLLAGWLAVRFLYIGAPPEHVKDNYDTALRMLDAFAEGSRSLPDAATGAASACLRDEADRTFSQETLTDYGPLH